MTSKPSPEVANERDAAYDKIDRFLRNNLDDTDYAEYSAALDTVLASTAAKADAGEDARDAARYRWLRAAWLADMDAGEDVAWSPIMHSCCEEQMDADIDRAIAGGTEP